MMMQIGFPWAAASPDGGQTPSPEDVEPSSLKRSVRLFDGRLTSVRPGSRSDRGSPGSPRRHPGATG